MYGYVLKANEVLDQISPLRRGPHAYHEFDKCHTHLRVIPNHPGSITKESFAFIKRKKGSHSDKLYIIKCTLIIPGVH